MGRRVLLLGVAVVVAACANFKSGGDAADGGAEGGESSSSGGAGSSGGGSSGATSSGGGTSGSSGGSTSSGGSSSGGASSGAASSSGGSTDGGVSDGSATGPGAYGALPSGYCCTADTDCRNRRCVDLGAGNKMCEDECDGFPAICTGILPGLTCLADDGGVSSYCMPSSASTACVAASAYVHGTKPTGACCTPQSDATNGRECAGGNCGSNGAESNPYICGNACSGQQDCMSLYSCQNIADYNLCVPLASTYSCTP